MERISRPEFPRLTYSTLQDYYDTVYAFKTKFRQDKNVQVLWDTYHTVSVRIKSAICQSPSISIVDIDTFAHIFGKRSPAH